MLNLLMVSKTKESNKKEEKKKEVSKKKPEYIENTIITFLFANLFLLISSYWFPYENFYLELIVVSLILGLSYLIKKYLPLISVVFTSLFYISFLFWNYNYMFIFGLTIVLGILGLHFLKPDLKIPHFTYTLIPILILGHIIWFNTLPLGFEGSWELDVGSLEDDDKSADLYIIDKNNVLSPRASYGEETWREFVKDGAFEIGFNTPIYLENKTVEISMEYETSSPIYVNGELFYDPAWGSSVNLGGVDNAYIYGTDDFDIEKNFTSVSVDKFLNMTGFNSVADYVLFTYNVSLDNYSSDVSLDRFLYYNNISLEEFIETYYPFNKTIELLNSIGFNSLSEYHTNLSVNRLLKVGGFKSVNEFNSVYLNLSNISSINSSLDLLELGGLVSVNQYLLKSNAFIYGDLPIEDFLRNMKYPSVSSFVLEYKSFSNVSELLNFVDFESLDSFNNYSSFDYFYMSNGFRNEGDFMDWSLNTGNYTKELYKFEYNSIPEFIRTEYPDGVLMRDFTGQYLDLEKEMNEKYIENINSVEYYDDWTDEPHTINATFRGGIKFYGVFNDSINLSFDKQDLNWYEGSDDLTVVIKSFNNTHLYNVTFPDNDGVVSKGNGTSDWINYELNYPLEKSGIYRIQFIENPSFKKQDFIIDKIKINTNKFVSEENFLLWSPGKLYFNSNRNINVNYWWNDKFQNVTFDNKINIPLKIEDKNTWKTYNLKNFSEIYFEKGFMKIDNRVNFGFWEKSIFKPELRPQIKISKTITFEKSNIQFKKIEKLEIFSFKKTKISKINININVTNE